MIEEIRIENFKGFSEEQIIPLAPLTLLFGTNSSGKTTILQSLLLLKQTFEEAESPETVLLPKGKILDMGSYKEMIYGHDVSRRLRLSFRLSRSYAAPRLPLRPFIRRSADEDSAHLSPWVRFSFASEKQKRFILDTFEIGTSDSDRPLAVFEPASISQGRISFRPHMFFFARRGVPFAKKFFALKDFDIEHPWIEQRWKKFNHTLPRAVQDIEQQLRHITNSIERLSARGQHPNSERANLKKTPLKARLAEMQGDKKKIEAMLQKFRNYTFEDFVNDIRTHNKEILLGFANFLPTGAVMPERSQSWFFDIREFTAIPQLTEMAAIFGNLFRDLLERIFYLGPLREYPERHYIFSGNVVSDVGKSGKLMPDLLFSNRTVVKRLNEWLHKFQIGYTLAAKTVTDPDVKDVFTLRLTDTTMNVNVSPLDVGFGISQVLPILVQGVVAKERIILVEQPEIHLHPALQAELGSFLADCISSKPQNQFIVETHSEHLILRLQRLVREKKLAPDDISVVFVSRAPSGATVTSLRLDEHGDFIDEWPEGFFPERLRELK